MLICLEVLPKFDLWLTHLSAGGRHFHFFVLLFFFLESNCQIKLGVYKPHLQKAALELGKWQGCTMFKTASLSFLTIIINSKMVFYSKWIIFYIIINFSAICTLSSYLSFFPLRPFLCHSPPLLLLSLTAAIQESDKVQVHTHTHARCGS